MHGAVVESDSYSYTFQQQEEGMIHRKNRQHAKDEAGGDDTTSAGTTSKDGAAMNEGANASRGVNKEDSSNVDENYDKAVRRATATKQWRLRIWMKILLVVGSFASLTLMASKGYISNLRLIQIITLQPVVLCLYVGLIQRPQSRQPWHKSILPLTLVVTVVASQLPLFIAAAMATLAVLGFSLATLGNAKAKAARIKHEQLQHVQQSSSAPPEPNATMTVSKISNGVSGAGGPVAVLCAAMVMLAVMLTENFMIWVVSATFIPGQRIQTAPAPLQDNGRAVIRYLLTTRGMLRHDEVVKGLRRVWNVQWSLVACMGSAFVTTDLFVDPKRYRAFFGVAARAVWTLAMARFIRTISFLLTVLPSPVPQCYAQRFPYPPPADWYSWIWVGLMPAIHGGCNDLILSGHATVTSTLACISTSVAGEDNWWFSAALWSMVVLDYTVEIYEGFHYSVDMWLGMIVVIMTWRNLQAWEDKTWPTPPDLVVPTNDSDGKEKGIQGAGPFLQAPKWQEVLIYSIPAAISYLQLVLLPQWTCNFIIVGYAVLAIGFYVKFMHTEQAVIYMHFVQHVSLCSLFMALGIYL